MGEKVCGMEVCQKSDGCVMFRDPSTSPTSYNQLNNLFDKHK